MIDYVFTYYDENWPQGTYNCGSNFIFGLRATMEPNSWLLKKSADEVTPLKLNVRFCLFV